MVWSDPRTWFSSAPTPPAAPAPMETGPSPPAFGARRRKTRRGGRKGSKRTRTGKRSNRA